jgi:hypothetical protein
MKKLDLHGVKHADVKDTVIRFIEKHWAGGTVQIIYGNSMKMATMVREVVEEYGLDYAEGPFGSLPVYTVVELD